MDLPEEIFRPIKISGGNVAMNLVSVDGAFQIRLANLQKGLSRVILTMKNVPYHEAKILDFLSLPKKIINAPAPKGLLRFKIPVKSFTSLILSKGK